MPSADDAAQFEAVGLFDATEGIVGRLELLRWLVEQGFTVDEMLHALASGRLSGLPGDRRLLAGALLRRDEAIAATGLEVQDFEAGVRAFGFCGLERSPDGEIGVTTEEASAIATFTAFGRMFTPAEAHAFFRVIGSSVARIADAAVSLFLADVESQSIAAGESELELARKVHDAVALLDGFTAALDPILRRHVMQAIERSRQTTISTTERLEYRYAVGFVDLVGFTQIAGAMAPDELAGFLRDFEARAHDAATAVGARVVKMIGDEVMFVSSDASSAVAAGDALMDGLGAAYEHIVPRGASGLWRHAGAWRRLLRFGGQPCISTGRRSRATRTARHGPARGRRARLQIRARRTPDGQRLRRPGGRALARRLTTCRTTRHS